MRETRADTTAAVLFAVLLHALLLAALLFGMWWSRANPPAAAAGSPVQADIVDPNALSVPMQRALRSLSSSRPTSPLPPTPPQPPPAPEPVEAPTPPQPRAQVHLPVPERVDQERVDRNAVSPDTREREQAEQHRQQQIDLTEQQRQEAAQSRERQRLQQLADIKKQREQAAREAQLAEQKLKQLADAQLRNPAQAAAQADAQATAPSGNYGADNDLRARYAAALQEAILRNWTRPDSVPLGQRCKLNIRQLPGGSVVDVQVDPSCPYDELGKRSVEAAVLKAQPLPYAGFESVFSRSVTVNFQAQEF